MLETDSINNSFGSHINTFEPRLWLARRKRTFTLLLLGRVQLHSDITSIRKENMVLIGLHIDGTYRIAVSFSWLHFYFTALMRERQKALKKTGIGGKWELIDPKGNKITTDDFKGKWCMIYFGFTHCPGSYSFFLSIPHWTALMSDYFQ